MFHFFPLLSSHSPDAERPADAGQSGGRPPHAAALQPAQPRQEQRRRPRAPRRPPARRRRRRQPPASRAQPRPRSHASRDQRQSQRAAAAAAAAAAADAASVQDVLEYGQVGAQREWPSFQHFLQQIAIKGMLSEIRGLEYMAGFFYC